MAKLQLKTAEVLTLADGRKVYATPCGLKITTRGKVASPAKVLGSLSKGEARRLRKNCYRLGLRYHAAAERTLNLADI